jgi:hypothetical protein
MSQPTSQMLEELLEQQMKEDGIFSPDGDVAEVKKEKEDDKESVVKDEGSVADDESVVVITDDDISDERPLKRPRMPPQVVGNCGGPASSSGGGGIDILLADGGRKLPGGAKDEPRDPGLDGCDGDGQGPSHVAAAGGGKQKKALQKCGRKSSSSGGGGIENVPGGGGCERSGDAPDVPRDSGLDGGDGDGQGPSRVAAAGGGKPGKRLKIGKDLLASFASLHSEGGDAGGSVAGADGAEHLVDQTLLGQVKTLLSDTALAHPTLSLEVRAGRDSYWLVAASGHWFSNSCRQAGRMPSTRFQTRACASVFAASRNKSSNVAIH